MAGFQWGSQLEQMASINVAAPDRSSLDSFHFLNEMLVCKCIVYHQQFVQLLWKFCAFYEKVKQESWSGGPCHFVCPNFGLLSSGFSETFPFFPSVSFLCSLSLPVPPWCTEWHVMLAPWLNFNDPIITSIHVWQRLRGKSMARRNNNTQRWNISGTKSAAQWFEKYAKICKTVQKKNPSILKNETAGTKPCLAIWESWNLL